MNSWQLRWPSVPNRSDCPERHSPSMQVDSEPEIAVLPEWHSVPDHAHRLVLHLAQNGSITGSVLSGELQRVHRRMCAELDWLPRPWAPIASVLRERAGGKKTYAWVAGHRLRVFAIDQLLSELTTDSNPTTLTRGEDDT